MNEDEMDDILKTKLLEENVRHQIRMDDIRFHYVRLNLTTSPPLEALKQELLRHRAMIKASWENFFRRRAEVANRQDEM